MTNETGKMFLLDIRLCLVARLIGFCVDGRPDTLDICLDVMAPAELLFRESNCSLWRFNYYEMVMCPKLQGAVTVL